MGFAAYCCLICAVAILIANFTPIRTLGPLRMRDIVLTATIWVACSLLFAYARRGIGRGAIRRSVLVALATIAIAVAAPRLGFGIAYGF
ncbi:hypothetical protein Poly51_63440 [Rubripirellula tenax]|uniref:Uncharacterized protein n=1 Tax=Rubripirellula tenax TaxID=2528015 RepID=A0A5C6E3S7_9BACT|nr:hypothetical protein Poly51_63440 [Rubripirellula tenax]